MKQKERNSVQAYLDEEGLVERTTKRVYAKFASHKSPEFVRRLRETMGNDCDDTAFYQAMCAKVNGIPVYDYLKGRVRKCVEWELRLMLPRLRFGKEDIIDVGCGNGLEAVFYGLLPDRNVTGIDLCPGMVDAAIERAKKRQMPNVHFRVGERSKLPVDADSFDILTCFNSIETGEDYHIFNMGEFYFHHAIKTRLEEFKRVLRPGGTMVIMFPTNDQCSSYIRDVYEGKFEDLGLTGSHVEIAKFRNKDNRTFLHMAVSAQKQ